MFNDKRYNIVRPIYIKCYSMDSIWVSKSAKCSYRYVEICVNNLKYSKYSGLINDDLYNIRRTNKKKKMAVLDQQCTIVIRFINDMINKCSENVIKKKIRCSDVKR